jgi:hypothetical protein
VFSDRRQFTLKETCVKTYVRASVAIVQLPSLIHTALERGDRAAKKPETV